MNKSRIIREFIYVDVPKLYSLYSQIFEGITDHVIEERINQLITRDTQGSFLKQASAESHGLESLRRVESSVLHDHMYNRLEEELEPTLFHAVDLDEKKIVQSFLSNPMIKITGRSEIEDYERIGLFFDQFNKLGEAIAYAGLIGSDEVNKKKIELQQMLDAATSKARKEELKKQMISLVDPKAAATKLGLQHDTRSLTNLKFLGEMFNPDGYDIVITPHDRPNLHFRGVLDKGWLRSEPQLISSLYGGQSEAPWVMVGIVTHVPDTYNSQVNVQAQQSNVPEVQNDPDNPMMLDGFRNMFRTSRVFERMFLESNTDTEIVVSPIAVYREFEVQIKKYNNE